MPNYGWKISKEGYDVKSCTDDQLVMSTKFNLLKTKTDDTVSGTNDINVAHGIGYVPFCFVIEKQSANHYSILGDTNAAQFQVGATYLTINAGVSTDYFRYYIFYQQGH